MEYIKVLNQIKEEYDKGIHHFYDGTNEKKNKRPLNYAKYRENFSLANWKEFWNFDQPYGQNIIDLYENFMLLPEQDIQLPIIAAFACQNTPLLNISNTLFVYSRLAGSGKSTVAELIAALQGVLQNKEMQQGASTFASVRNFIQNHQYYTTPGGFPLSDRVTQTYLEKNICLILDDFPAASLGDPSYYNLLKSYKRSSAFIKKAERIKDSPDEPARDVVVSFAVFCNKVLTACYMIFGNPTFQELTRRCFFIKCLKLEDIPGYSELDARGGLDEFFKVSEVDWSGIDQEFHEAWDESAVARYQEVYKQLRKPNNLTTAQWEISKPLVASGVALGVWQDGLSDDGKIISARTNALKSIKRYWDWFIIQGLDSKSGIELVLESAIDTWILTANNPDENQPMFSIGKPNPYFPMKPDLIATDWIELKLEQAKKRGELDKNPSAKIRNEVMELLGYRLRRLSGHNHYCPID